MSDAPRQTIVWYRSAVLWGIAISATMKLLYLVFRFKPPFGEAEEQALAEVVTIFASLIGDTIAARGRFASNAQPITLTEEKSNEARPKRRPSQHADAGWLPDHEPAPDESDRKRRDWPLA
jgi:hypothetical protein